MRKLHV